MRCVSQATTWKWKFDLRRALAVAFRKTDTHRSSPKEGWDCGRG
jgi:hypothetical protein